jgi:hypothetical protein
MSLKIIFDLGGKIAVVSYQLGPSTLSGRGDGNSPTGIWAGVAGVSGGKAG